MSPLSDTTNLAPAMAGTDLYTHIRHMAYTTGVSMVLTLIIEGILSFFYGGGDANLIAVSRIINGLDTQFYISPLLLIPPAIVMTGKMYSQAYRDKGLHAKKLSRALEDSATVTANLVPWNSGGAYMTATLGVATIAYLPFNFFCWISPIVSLLFGLFNITIEPRDGTEAVFAEDIQEEPPKK